MPWSRHRRRQALIIFRTGRAAGFSRTRRGRRAGRLCPRRPAARPPSFGRERICAAARAGFLRKSGAGGSKKAGAGPAGAKGAPAKRARDGRRALGGDRPFPGTRRRTGRPAYFANRSCRPRSFPPAATLNAALRAAFPTARRRVVKPVRTCAQFEHCSRAPTGRNRPPVLARSKKRAPGRAGCPRPQINTARRGRAA